MAARNQNAKGVSKKVRNGFGGRGVEEMERRVLLSAAIAVLGDQQTFLSGNNPLSVALGDVNRDGKLDAVVANNTGDAVSVLLNDGTGQFPGKQSFAAGTGPISLALGDLNGDGKLDVAVADFGGGTVSVLAGNGDGTFAAPVTTAVGSGPIGVAVADVNGDGKPDVLAANYSSGTVSVLLGNGNGTFSAAGAVSAGTNPIAVTAADFNGDGKLDLAVANYTGGSGTVSVMLGNRDGTFAARQTFATGAQPRDVVAADMNRDGKADLVVSDKGADSVSVLPGNGDGTFGAQQTSATDATPRGLAVADLNVDGKPDVVTSNGSGTVSVLPGNGDGTLAGQGTFAASTNPYWVATGDVNGDGRPDVVVVNRGTNIIPATIGVMLGDVPPSVVGITKLSPATQPTGASTVVFGVTFSQPVTGVDASDFVLAPVFVTATTPVVVSGSGANYTVTVNGVSGSGSLGLNLVDDGSIKNAAGNPLGPGAVPAYVFQTQQTFSGGGRPYASTLADVNGDGKLDLVTTNGNALAAVSVALGNGNGTFGTSRNITVPASPRAVAVADVTRDGKPDLVVASSGGWISVLAGNGDGTFKARVTYAVSNAPYGVAVADLNGDGILDVATPDNFGATVSVLLGNANGTFGPEKTFSVGNTPNAIAATDLNGDGKADLVVTNGNDHTVSVLIGNGDGNFAAQATYAAGTYDSSLAVGDVNGDGKADVVVGNNNFSNAGSLSIFVGNGDGTLAPQQTVADALGPTGVTLADLNNDGKLDVATSNFGNSGDATFGVFLGNGNGTFGAREAVPSAAGSRSLAAGDVNGDGRADVLVSNSVSANVGVYLMNPSGGFTGPLFTIVPNQITGTAGDDSITLTRDPNGTDIDWVMGSASGQIPANHPEGIVISGGGGNDVITLDYSNGNPLPNTLHLNGTFTINGLASNDSPLAGTKLEIGRSTVWITYSFLNPAAAIRAALSAGYSGGAWNGTSANGVITSSAAAGNSSHNTGIGWADSADGSGVNTVANSIELKYTLNGDTNLNGVVDIFDLNNLLPHYNKAGDWTGGDGTYNGGVDIFDLNALLPNYNTSLGSQVRPATAPAAAVAGTASVGAAASPTVATAEAVNAGVDLQTRKRGDKGTKRKVWGGGG